VPHERVLGLQEQFAVLGVEPEQPGKRRDSAGRGTPDLGVQAPRPLFKQPERLAWGQRGYQPECYPERRGPLGRVTQNPGQPVAHLGPAR
jgi:hypothetical protein